MKKTTVELLITVLVVIVLVAAAILWGNIAPSPKLMFGAVLVIFLLITLKANRKGGVKVDELSTQIGLKSSRNSWFGVIVYVGVVGNLIQYKLVNIDAQTALAYVAVTMMATFWISHLYYRKHPDAR